MLHRHDDSTRGHGSHADRCLTNPVATALQIVRAMRRNVTARAYGRIDARTFNQRIGRLWREAEVAGDEVYALVNERFDGAAA